MGKSLSKCLSTEMAQKPLIIGSKPIPRSSGENLTFGILRTVLGSRRFLLQAEGQVSAQGIFSPERMIFQHASVIEFHIQSKKQTLSFGPKKSLPGFH